jgi:hypothetical protein
MTQFTHAKKGAVMAMGAALALCGAGPAAAQDARRATVLQTVIDCRAVADTAARLACYDAAVAGLDQAEAKGDVVVMDREQTRQARREAFGFSMPSFAMFERGNTEAMDRAAFKVVRATEGNDGTWTIETDAGAIWRQTDQERLSRRPKPGTSVEIRSAAMGGYFMNVDGQRAIRVTRVK